MRFAVDTGGTFTDLVVEQVDGTVELFKSSTTPENPVEGVLNVLDVAAESFGRTRSELLADGTLFIHGTTRAINAVLTGSTARTAFLTTKGHPDILLFREGGRHDPFDLTIEYPEPYVPRSLTFEVTERITADGAVLVELDEAELVGICEQMRERGVEAVGVCLLWSIANDAHERRVGELLEEHLPGVPYTLSHVLNPSLREYRRASSAVIDASLKPLMTDYLASLERRLVDSGFSGRVLMVTAAGGLIDAATMAGAPIHSLGSGPAMAPIAGRYCADADAGADTAIVADTGGTSYDVSLVRRGLIPRTRETWLGREHLGHITGFPSVDVKSIGAGGGSIAWVDDGGLLHVGPQSAGAVPGPACYGRGGESPTVSDCSLLLGHLDPEYFLGGALRLDVERSERALTEQVADVLGMSTEEAAAAVLRLATEHMARAIEEITVNQGIDPAGAVLVAGGGAAGLNAVAIARRIGAERVVIPAFGATLSAAGALLSDLTSDHTAPFFTGSRRFDAEGVNRTLEALEERCRRFIADSGARESASAIDFVGEARYASQVWELEVPLRAARFTDADAVAALLADFHDLHENVFAFRDEDSPIECVSWRATARCRLREGGVTVGEHSADDDRESGRRTAYFLDAGRCEADVVAADRLAVGEVLEGPIIVESRYTTVVVDPGATVERSSSGSLLINPGVGASVLAPSLDARSAA